MKMLTLTQPWACLWATGAKVYETRSWGTGYRGLIGIHAAKGFPTVARQLCDTDPFLAALSHWGYPENGLPTGAVIGVIDLVGCQRMRTMAQAGFILMQKEGDFGDWSDPGRYAWHGEHPRVLPEPIPAKGSLGLWIPSPELELQIMEQFRLA